MLGQLHAVLDPGALLGIGNVHELGADMPAIGALQDAQHLAERAVFEAERAADIDRPVEVGLGEAVGLRLELGMLAPRDELERIELGDEMAARAIGADQHAQADRVALSGDELLLRQPTFRRRCGQGGRAVGPRPGGPARLGEHRGLVVVEAREESLPFRIERGRVPLVACMQICEIGGVSAVQERRAEKHVVQFVSRHRIDPAGSFGQPA